MASIQKGLFGLAKSTLGKFLVQLGFTTPLSRILPINKVYEDDFVLAFHHPKPFWETHIVIVPKKTIGNLDETKDADLEYIAMIIKVARDLVERLDLKKMGYRLLTNGGKYQKVKYLHFHLGAGKQLQVDEDGSSDSTPTD